MQQDEDKTCDLNHPNLVGVYKTTSVKYKASPTSPEEDKFSTWAPCEKDDLVVFKSNAMGDLQDAGLLCSPTGDNTFSWTLAGNVQTVDGFIPSTISSFNCSAMQITINDPLGGVTITTVTR